MWQGWGQPGYMTGHDGIGWYLGMGLHGLLSLVILGILIVAGVALIRYLWRAATGSPTESASAGGGASALSMLEQRYAKGEIDRDEFLLKKKDLSG